MSQSLPFRSVRPLRGLLAAAPLACASLAADATEVIIRITGLTAPFGQIGCTLFSEKKGFPTDPGPGRGLWQPGGATTATCRFADVPAGTYAVSVGHDVNGNRKIDTNFVGIPTEQWGVSNNIRPTMRAPRFEEASFKVDGTSGELAIDIKVDK